MLNQLTRSERNLGTILTGLVLLAGLAMAIGGSGDLMGAQGWIVVVFSVAVLLALLLSLNAPEPSAGRIEAFYDGSMQGGGTPPPIWGGTGRLLGGWGAAPCPRPPPSPCRPIMPTCPRMQWATPT